MSVSTFLAELRSRDIQVWPDGDHLRCNAPAGELTPDLRDELRQRKRDIVEFLHSAETLARQPRAIVPLQRRGNRVPVFAVPGHNGDVFCYRALAQHLGDDQPFFGLQPPGVDGHSEPLESIEDLAAYFAAQIRAFRPDGPYAIAGFCAGGTIAFELARQLLQQGAAISSVALFSSPDPKSYRVLPLLRQRIAHHVKRVSKHARALALRSNTERRQYITEIVRRRNAAGRDSAPSDPVLVLRAKVQAATTVGLRRHTPRYFDSRVILFLPNKECLRAGNSLLFWRGVTRETEEYCGPDGCEGDLMLLEPHASAIAELFRSCRPT
ncbi:MAG: thioesterase domain-containing protein [Thermoanaerobaculia bacterium]